MEEDLIDLFPVFVRDKCRNTDSEVLPDQHSRASQILSFYEFLLQGSQRDPNKEAVFCFWNMLLSCALDFSFSTISFTETQPAFSPPISFCLYASHELESHLSLQLYWISPSTSDYRPLEDRNSKQCFILYFQVHEDPPGMTFLISLNASDILLGLH